MTSHVDDAHDVVVILPTIVFDRRLNAAVESILANDYDRFRLLVVADGAAPAAAPDWSADDRVSMRLQPQRLGLATTLQLAIADTSEPLIARLDADDLSAPDRLRIQVQYMRENPDAALIGTLADRFNDHDEALGPLRLTSGDDVRHELVRRNCIVHSSVMFRRSAYDAAGGFNPQRVRMQDYDLWLRMAQFGRVAVLPKVLTSYRVHPGQVSRKSPSRHDIRDITRYRWELARALGKGRVAAFVDVAPWNVAQILIRLRLRKLGYLKNISVSVDPLQQAKEGSTK